MNIIFKKAAKKQIKICLGITLVRQPLLCNKEAFLKVTVRFCCAEREQRLQVRQEQWSSASAWSE
jgi:hypothetical protein